MKTKLTRSLLTAAIAFSASLVGSPAAAQDFSNLTAGDWKFHAQVYFWFPSVSGKTMFPPPATGGTTVNADAGDILDALQFAFMGSFDARKGKLGMLTDYIYLNMEADKSATRDLTLTGPGGNIALPAGASADLTVDLKGWAWTLAGTYTAIETPSYQLDVLAGTRLLKMDTTLSWTLNGNLGSLAVARTGANTAKPDWWDAIVGVRGRARFGEGGKWFVPYYADIGTGQSDLTWQALAGVGYTFNWGEIVGVYRHLEYSFDSSKALQDISFTGPAIAVGFRW
jgi:hypothetical protein